jgi:RimJ/RimL family protein N-acetyltransferase
MTATLHNLGPTDRLEIRAPQAADIDTLVGMWTDPLVTQHIGGPREPQPVREFFGAYAADPESTATSEREWWWTIVERSSGAIVGLVSLVTKEVESHEEVDLGYFVRAGYWRHGYATEAARVVVNYAFQSLGLTSLVASIDPSNNPSIGVALRLGMALEQKVLRPDGVSRLIFRLRRPALDGAQAPA